MKRYVVDNFPFSITEAELLKAVRMDKNPDDPDYLRLMEMLHEAGSCARPKFCYGIAAIEEKGPDFIIVEGHRIDSGLVRKNLDQAFRIIPYVATCGHEVDAWSRQFRDLLEQYWADEIKNLLLTKSANTLHQTVRGKFFAGQDLSRMSPGSLPEWPLREQKLLFSLMGSVSRDIGVELTESCLMIPSKSISGFYFSSENHFENCQLCPMANCPGRRAAYQPADQSGRTTG